MVSNLLPNWIKACRSACPTPTWAWHPWGTGHGSPRRTRPRRAFGRQGRMPSIPRGMAAGTGESAGDYRHRAALCSGNTRRSIHESVSTDVQSDADWGGIETVAGWFVLVCRTVPRPSAPGLARFSPPPGSRFVGVSPPSRRVAGLTLASPVWPEFHRFPAIRARMRHGRGRIRGSGTQARASCAGRKGTNP